MIKGFDFLRKYQELQHGVMYDKLIDLSFARIGYSEIDRATFWNFALTDKVLSSEELTIVKEELQKLERKAAIYFVNKDDLNPLSEFLTQNGYVKDYEDSWMFYKDLAISESRFNQVKKVETEQDLETFLKTFDNCYQKDDPINPYGELGDYLKVAEKVWHKHKDTNRLEYFIAYKETKPVAVATLTNYEGIGYISNVGSLREVRGEGYGKLVTLFCVYTSQKHNNSIHCIATEEGTYPNDFYKRIGFETLFTGICYTQK
jgi:ribosomal protein S18 acetylase RimI-like enzyme